MIVDDEPDLREIFSDWLTVAGCAPPHTAANGAAALAVIRVQPIDLLITDVRMPIMDGITLVRRLNELDIHIPSIVFVSGFADVDLREMYHFGVEAFLSKPLTSKEFMARVERALAERSSLWLDPMDPTPRQSLRAEIGNIARQNDPSSYRTDSLCLGRGGFSTRASSQLGLGSIIFSCLLPEGPPEFPIRRVFAGQGIVRWFSKTDWIVGIELAYLDPACRTWVIDELSRSTPTSFIPDLRILHQSGTGE